MFWFTPRNLFVPKTLYEWWCVMNQALEHQFQTLWDLFCPGTTWYPSFWSIWMEAGVAATLFSLSRVPLCMAVSYKQADGQAFGKDVRLVYGCCGIDLAQRIQNPIWGQIRPDRIKFTQLNIRVGHVKQVYSSTAFKLHGSFLIWSHLQKHQIISNQRKTMLSDRLWFWSPCDRVPSNRIWCLWCDTKLPRSLGWNPTTVHPLGSVGACARSPSTPQQCAYKGYEDSYFALETILRCASLLILSLSQ